MLEINRPNKIFFEKESLILLNKYIKNKNSGKQFASFIERLFIPKNAPKILGDK